MFSSIKRISVSLFLGANLCTILLMWLCVALTYVSPELIPRLSLLTLTFPVFLCVNALFIVFWLLFHARLVWVPIVGMLVVGGYILDYCPLNFGNSSTASDGTLTVVSYNVGRITDDEQREELIRFLTTANADIVCLQELSRGFLVKHKKWIDSTAYHVLQGNSIVILSRKPFIGDTIHINYPTRSNHSLACWIDCDGDSLLVINNHLESNMLSIEEKNEYTNAIKEPGREAIKNSSHMLIGKLSRATGFRAAQTDTICAFIDRMDGHSIIVCGDLNETPVSYTYQKIARRLTSAYQQAGRGPGFSYSERSFPVRIDHLFFSNQWECTSCHIERTVLASDHYPLIARLRKKIR